MRLTPAAPSSAGITAPDAKIADCVAASPLAPQGPSGGGRSRGGADIETLQRTDRTGRGDRIDRAAARKRLLYGRYLGWATGNHCVLDGQGPYPPRGLDYFNSGYAETGPHESVEAVTALCINAAADIDTAAHMTADSPLSELIMTHQPPLHVSPRRQMNRLLP